MENYLDNLIRVINHINNNNTYKAAWALSIIDCIKGKEFEEVLRMQQQLLTEYKQTVHY